ncbi:PREDICTED: uncharacterized protein LOC108612779 [Drosophila arizonae]|uniref:Uncharacterized protein LOC108612779 n=1 Tax=Drosophila arizonae TaxID=7263 RepID=A0ABM1P231_DROAR|nr:PREDICTED: uncharacterized protein LOC108612779 [Drosophila arizonae]
MLGIVQQVRDLLRVHYNALGVSCLICVSLVGILDYSHGVYGCDLYCWQEQLDLVEDKPMALLLLIASFKLIIIVILTLLSYTQTRPALEQSIGQLKRRYRRFIVMRLLAAHHKFLYGAGELQHRHSELLLAIQLFRSDARKLYERSAEQLRQNVRQMLHVEEQLEQELLQRGYDRYKCVSQLRDVDIYRLVLAMPFPKA